MLKEEALNERQAKKYKGLAKSTIKRKSKISDFLPREMTEILDKSERKIGEHERILLSLLVQVIVEIVIKEEL